MDFERKWNKPDLLPLQFHSCRVPICARVMEETSPLLDSSPLSELCPTLTCVHNEIPSDALYVRPADYASSHVPHQPVTTESSEEFMLIIQSVQAAIDQGIYPLLIAKGSSGSYFCRNEQGVIVGIFKPKNEEPYASRNPKWVKWLHRTLLPCCFGRECIVPNFGYISEACASYVDRKLGLGIVPRTEIVRLTCSAFHYSLEQRWYG